MYKDTCKMVRKFLIAVCERLTDASYDCEKDRKTSWFSVFIHLIVKKGSVFLTCCVKGVSFVKRYTKGILFL